jgi:alpha-tubulin suppressor-like RCC1 family protein
LHPGWPDASVWGKNIIFLLVLLLDEKYQKSSANDAPPRSKKTVKIQAKDAGLYNSASAGGLVKF